MVFDADTMDHWWPPTDEAAMDYARRIEYIAEEYSKGDVYLLGRTTYEMLWPGWSTQTDTLGSILNRMKKYVVSTRGRTRITAKIVHSREMFAKTRDEIRKATDLATDGLQIPAVTLTDETSPRPWGPSPISVIPKEK